MLFSNEMRIAVINCRKGLAEFKVTITLMKVSICVRKVTEIKFSIFNKISSKKYKLRQINAIECSSGHVSVQDGKIYNIKIEIISLIYI